MTLRTDVAIGIALLFNAVLLCAGAFLILGATGMHERAVVLLPLVVLMSFVLAPTISAWLAAHTDSGAPPNQRVGRHSRD